MTITDQQYALTDDQFSGLMILLGRRPNLSEGEYRQRHGLTDDADWAAACQRAHDELQAIREDLFEQRRPEAEQRYRASLDRYYEGTEYSGDNPPPYKAPGSDEWEQSVRSIMDQMQYDQPDNLLPLVGFHDPDDFDGCELRVETIREEVGEGRFDVRRIYRTRAGQVIEPWPAMLGRIDPLIEQANGQHRRREHATGIHPWCEECEVRIQRSPWLNRDLDNAGRSDEEIKQAARQRIEARVLGLLVRDNGRVPAFSARIPEETSNPWTSLADLLDQEPPGWLFEGVVPQHGLGYLTGRDGTFKTFLALDLAMHLVTDQAEWHGRAMEEDVRSGEAVFVAGEGSRSFGKRISAWLTEHDEPMTKDLAERLHIRSGSVNLYTGGPAYDELLDLCEARKPELVVIDTLQTNSTGAESNSASDMGEVTARLHALKLASEGTVLVLAHTGKSDQDARGSSSIEDDADFVLHVKPDDQALALKITKQKDGDSGFTVDLKAVPAHGSVVIRPGRPEPEWASDNLANRIRGVLYAVREGDEPTASQVLAMVKDDGTGKPAGRTQTYAALGELEREGVVVGSKSGTKAKTYRLDLSQYPEEAR